MATMPTDMQADDTDAADFNFQPVLRGTTVLLRPLQADDFDALHAAAADPLIWQQHPDPERYRRDIFASRFFAEALAGGRTLVVIDRASGRIIGSTRFYDWQPATAEIAIGYTFLARSHWGGDTNGEMKRLMLAHAFTRAGTVWFHIARDNLRSRRAVEKIGGRLAHAGMKTVNSVAVDYVFYRIDAPRQER